jgi:dihydroxyacetone kinase-like predicted kinase
MNPSTKELLISVESVASDKVIILPNNKNIVATAQQVQSLTQKTVEVVPTQTIPQGVAALLAFDYEADFRTNTEIMGKARLAVRTIEITRAVRATQLGGLKIKKRQPIGMLDGDLVAVGDNDIDVISKVLARIDLEHTEIITIYYGINTQPSEAEQTSSVIRDQYPQLQIEVVHGGQPHYNYIVSIE